MYNPFQSMTEKVRNYSIEWRENLSRVRGSVWPEIERYAKMGLTPAEILVARGLEGQENYPYSKVENALRKARERGLLPRRTPDERSDNRVRHLNSSPTDIKERIRLMLDQSDKANKELACIFATRPELIPSDPVHRQYTWRLYEARREWVETGDRTLIDNFPDYEIRYPDITKELSEQIAYIRDLTPVRRKNIVGRASEAMVVYSEVERD